MNQKKYRVESPRELEILWMYFDGKKCLTTENETAFRDEMRHQGLYGEENKTDRSKKMSYVRKALEDAYKEYNLPIPPRGMDYFALTDYIQKRVMLSPQPVEFTGHVKNWAGIVEKIKKVFDDVFASK